MHIIQQVPVRFEWVGGPRDGPMEDGTLQGPWPPTIAYWVPDPDTPQGPNGEPYGVEYVYSLGSVSRRPGEPLVGRYACLA